MAMIGEKPFMEYVVHELSRHGITDIIFAVGYKGSMVEEYLGTAAVLPRRTELPSRCIMLTKKNFSVQPEPSKMLADLSRRTVFCPERGYVYQIDYSRLVTMQQESDLDMALVLRKCRIFPGTEQPC